MRVNWVGVEFRRGGQADRSHGVSIIQLQEAIRAYFAGVVTTGRKFAVGEQRPAVISGDLAFTSTRLPDGTVTAESLPRATIREPAPDPDPRSPAARPTAPGSGSSTSSPTRRSRVCA
jgi:hypothetical protein